MTPEERWTRIENAMQTVFESHAQFAVDIELLKSSQLKTDEQMRLFAKDVRDSFKDVRDSFKTIAEEVRGANKRISRLAAAQEFTEDVLQKLIQRLDSPGRAN